MFLNNGKTRSLPDPGNEDCPGRIHPHAIFGIAVQLSPTLFLIPSRFGAWLSNAWQCLRARSHMRNPNFFGS